MITNFKIFENVSTDYAKVAKKGDILVCMRNMNQHDSKEMHKDLQFGNRYEILSIDSPKSYDCDQYYYFDLKNLKTNEIITGYGAVLFQPESNFDANKFNL